MGCLGVTSNLRLFLGQKQYIATIGREANL
jgi:hypothetical protein